MGMYFIYYFNKNLMDFVVNLNFSKIIILIKLHTAYREAYAINNFHSFGYVSIKQDNIEHRCSFLTLKMNPKLIYNLKWLYNALTIFKEIEYTVYDLISYFYFIPNSQL